MGYPRAIRGPPGKPRETVVFNVGLRMGNVWATKGKDMDCPYKVLDNPWGPHRLPMGRPRKRMGYPWVTHGLPMGFPWDSNGQRMEGP